MDRHRSETLSDCLVGGKPRSSVTSSRSILTRPPRVWVLNHEIGPFLCGTEKSVSDQSETVDRDRLTFLDLSCYNNIRIFHLSGFLK